MSSVKILPSPLCGRVTIPASKSACHRSIICAALGCGTSIIKNCGTSSDIEATLNGMKALGTSFRENNGVLIVERNNPPKSCTINCKESGSTLRFLLPIAAALGVNATFTGEGRLPTRPIKALTDVLRQGGVECSSDTLPLTINRQFKGGQYSLPGNISSQYITGLLFALALTKTPSQIVLTTNLESAPYIDMTISEMKYFGVYVETCENGYKISANQSFCACDRTIEGDWSQAAFFMSAAAIAGSITIKGLLENSLQGDRKAVDVFRDFGADVLFSNGELNIKKGNLKGISVDASQIPDMVPAIAVTAAFAEGTTIIHSAARLRAKESDRLLETAKRLRAFGVNVDETADGLIIHGGAPTGASIDGANDHRIVMAFAIAAANSRGTSVIDGFEAINKSYPHFFDDFNNLGGNSNVL
ncbi:MAG: 3-phosphoshikimate 1-carboxyvinyltransferase [Oscillospiraceae bacterium]|nr:3-phosphoshikimate 1-carboxyvinyltransferase [Oscillospiraceae bacterium]